MTTAPHGQDSVSRLEPMLRKLEYWQKFSREDREAVLSLPHTVKQLEAHNFSPGCIFDGCERNGEFSASARFRCSQRVRYC